MKKAKYHLNIGGASLLLLIVVFAMSIFAVLSIRASFHELQMAEKNRDAAEAYYLADAAAEEIYARLALTWQELNRAQRSDGAAVLEQAGDFSQELFFEAAGDCLTYFVEVDYNKSIQVTIQFSEDTCQVLNWRLVNEENGSYDGEEIEIWDGIVAD